MTWKFILHLKHALNSFYSQSIIYEYLTWLQTGAFILRLAFLVPKWFLLWMSVHSARCRHCLVWSPKYILRARAWSHALSLSLSLSFSLGLPLRLSGRDRSRLNPIVSVLAVRPRGITESLPLVYAVTVVHILYREWGIPPPLVIEEPRNEEGRSRDTDYR